MNSVYLPAMETIVCAILFTLLSGVGDAQGFLHAGRVWNDGQFQWPAALAVLSGIGWLMFRTAQ